MSFDPIQLASEIKRSYAYNLIGINPPALWNILGRMGDPDLSPYEKLGDFVKIQGPFIQALNIPRWSSRSWRTFAQGLRAQFAPHGLEPEIIETFEELRFRRLYEFQEQSMQAILDDQHTLVVASTGRGKTESWLIPLFQYIVARKRDKFSDGTQIQSTKALLIYPTKALAQDQLKRLLNYLFRLNRKLEPAARISVGIFDGDTPFSGDANANGYLRSAFQYFRCPIYNDSEAICRGCGQHLSVVYSDEIGDRPILAVPNSDCRQRAPLDFVYLVRDDIRDGMPDIVLTNPDMLNLRLLNVNGQDERRFLIEQPKFIILDEVHTYTELFGSFSSFIFKRFKLQRNELRTIRQGLSSADLEPLRLIAASATVANDLDLFTRLCNLREDEVRLVREEPLTLQDPAQISLPAILVDNFFTDDGLTNAILALGTGNSVPQNYQNLFDIFGLDAKNLPDFSLGEDALLRTAADVFFEVLTGKPSQTPDLNILRALYFSLSKSPMTPERIREQLLLRFHNLNPSQADNLAQNFYVLGAFSGLLENRIHMFAWPVDGYYVCVRCGHVYHSVQDHCAYCGFNFVTKLVLCEECGEEALESWYCPSCQHLYPFIVTVEGENNYYQRFTCSCKNEAIQNLRVIWKPFYRCAECGYLTRLSTNVMNGKAPNNCPHCEKGKLEPILSLPWICKKCGTPYFDPHSPKKCTCGARSFALAGLFDIEAGVHCNICKGDFLDGHPSEHRPLPEGDYSEYKLLGPDQRILKPASFRSAVPCYHTYSRYTKTTRYEKLMRSPANVAVTTAQFALRKCIRSTSGNSLQDRMKEAKILCFSDSYSDMEQLAQDFDEPEKNTFIDQVIITLLNKNEMSLKELQDGVINYARNYSQQLGLAGRAYLQEFDWVEYLGRPVGIRDEVTRRFVGGFYNNKTGRSPWLVREGIADVFLITQELDDGERKILAALAHFNNQNWENLKKELSEEVANINEILEKLERRNLVTRSGRDRISLNPDALRCSLVSAHHPIWRDAERGGFYSSLIINLRQQEHNFHPYSVPYYERLNPKNPDFSYYAYRVSGSQPLLLRSEVYKGDISKIERRKIEYSFKFKTDLHFLSSGPAMEVGIDVGDLDMLWLYGTPPNINNYLQRIGRAGRRSKRSLVLSVSKRNPIDYYYFRHPEELIISEPQPVPMNEFNEEVMRAALTWALLDFIADHYWIPWRKERTQDGQFFTDGMDFSSLSEPAPAGITNLTTLLFAVSSRELEDGLPLKALTTVLQDRYDLAKSYLLRLLGYRICERCRQHVPAEFENCLQPDCQGTPRLVSDLYLHLIDDVLENFSHRMVDFLVEFKDELRRKHRESSLQLFDVEDQLRRPRISLEGRRSLQSQASRLHNRVRAIDGALGHLDTLKFVDAQKYTGQARFAFNIRNVTDSVEILAYEEHNGQIRAIPRSSRDMLMATREYHPYAVTLTGRSLFLTRAVEFDPWKTEEIRASLAATGMAQLPWTCVQCGRVFIQINKPICTCGGILLQPMPVALQRAEIHPLNLGLGDDPDRPGSLLYPEDVFRLAAYGQKVTRTIPKQSRRVLGFNSVESLQIVGKNGNQLGFITYGDLEVASFTEGCSVLYENGLREPWLQPFVVCGEAGCHGVIVQSRRVRFCAIDHSHDLTKQILIWPTYLYRSKGIRIQLFDQPEPVAHAFAHGLRMALEKTAGMSVRNINELFGDDGIYVYDSIPGGAGVTELLLRQINGKYQYFIQAIKTISEVVTDCSCRDGCPHCIYQYGCENWNEPKSLSRVGLVTFLDLGPSLISEHTSGFS